MPTSLECKLYRHTKHIVRSRCDYRSSLKPLARFKKDVYVCLFVLPDFSERKMSNFFLLINNSISNYISFKCKTKESLRASVASIAPGISMLGKLG